MMNGSIGDMTSAPREFGDWLDEFADDLRPSLLALDLGCGLGDDTALLMQRGLVVVAMDIDTQRVRVAQQRAPGARFIAGDLSQRLPFHDASFNLVVASLSLHYFDTPTTAAIVGEIVRVLTNGGVLLARVNAVGDVNHGYGQGIELEPEFFEVEPGWRKRFFSVQSLRTTLEPTFQIDLLRSQETDVAGEGVKRTLVTRARKPELP